MTDFSNKHRYVTSLAVASFTKFSLTLSWIKWVAKQIGRYFFTDLNICVCFKMTKKYKGEYFFIAFLVSKMFGKTSPSPWLLWHPLPPTSPLSPLWRHIFVSAHITLTCCYRIPEATSQTWNINLSRKTVSSKLLLRNVVLYPETTPYELFWNLEFNKVLASTLVRMCGKEKGWSL